MYLDVLMTPNTQTPQRRRPREAQIATATARRRSLHAVLGCVLMLTQISLPIVVVQNDAVDSIAVPRAASADI